MSDESYWRWFTSPETWFETLQNGESVESVGLPWIPWRAAIWSRHSETWKRTSHHRLHGTAGTSERGKTQKGLKGVESCIGPFQEGMSIILVTNRLLYATEERTNKTHSWTEGDCIVFGDVLPELSVLLLQPLHLVPSNRIRPGCRTTKLPMLWEKITFTTCLSDHVSFCLPGMQLQCGQEFCPFLCILPVCK